MNPKTDGCPTPYCKVLKRALPKFGAINGNPDQNLVSLCYRGVRPHKLQLLLQIHPGPNQLTTAGSMQHEINGVGGTQGLSDGVDFRPWAIPSGR